MESRKQTNDIHINSGRISILDKIIHLLVFLLILYEGWYVEKFGAIPYLLQVLAVLLSGFTILQVISSFTGKIKLISPATGWFFFGLISVFVAITKPYAPVALDALFTYFCFWVVCVCIGNACKQDGNLIRKAVFVVILLSVGCVLIDGYPYKNGSYYGITLGPNNNPNTLGAVMAIGVYYILNPQDKATYLNWVFRILASIVCFFVVIRTGSRSGFLCYGTAVALTLFFQFLAYGKTQKSKITRRFLIMLMLVLIGLFLFDFIKNIKSGITGIHRLLNEFRIDAYSDRTDLFVEAWEFFKKYPVFGIGYKCFGYLSSFDYFTHTTYMELLSCTGLVGFSLFLYPCVRAVISAWQHRKKDLGRSFAVLMIFAANGLFGIVYYNLLFMVVLYCEIVKARTLGAGEVYG